VGFMGVIESEYYSIATSAALDVHNCAANASSGTITSGNITPGTSGDLLWQFAANLTGLTTGFTVGSHANITWTFDGTNINDSRLAAAAVQAGVYSSTAQINPTFTSGTAQPYDSCTMALKVATAGTAPTQPFRKLIVTDAETPNATGGGTTTTVAQINATGGDLIVIAQTSGGDWLTSVTSTPSNTWTVTTHVANLTAVNFAYAQNASVSNNMTLNITRDGNTTDGTFIIYVIKGSLTPTSFDVVSTGESGTQNSLPTTLTTCSGCLTTSQANEMVIGAAGWANCTATNFSSPVLASGNFDMATDTNNNVDGPQTVSQNNGGLAGLKAVAGSITTTWNITCGAANLGSWASQMIAFKGAPTGKLCTIALTGAGPC
jgi:hypothetical protein